MLTTALPIDEIFEDLQQGLASDCHQYIIHAPPGAGKSTRLPLWLLDEPCFQGKKILLIQPRRLAAANVAAFLAEQLSEPVGQQIGLKTRDETIISTHTRLEVITQGVFVRLIQQNPSLEGVSCVLFDEFHERSLQMDLGLSLCLDCQFAFRESDEPLSVMVMSATLAGDKLKDHLLNDAILLRCEGRCYPVDTRYEPIGARNNLVDYLPGMLQRVVVSHEGSVLVFLPGMREIRRVYNALKNNKLPGVELHILHASLSRAEQRRALTQSASGTRKLVLATNVAETSLTIDGITVVVDSGLVRASYFDRHKGISLLKTQRISRASAEQRQGRAGRLSAGYCYRLWSRESHSTLLDFDRPEICSGDLSSLFLELALWGEVDNQAMMFIDQPDDVSVEAARRLLLDLQLVDAQGAITAGGRRAAGLGLPPRLAAMCLQGERQGAASLAVVLATLLSERDLVVGRQANLSASLEALSAVDRHIGISRDIDLQLAQHILKQSRRLLRRVNKTDSFGLSDLSLAPTLLAAAFPDRIAKMRSGNKGKPDGRYLLSGGQEVILAPDDMLYGSPYLVVLDYGNQRIGQGSPRVSRACELPLGVLEGLVDELGRGESWVRWEESKQAVIARQQILLGAIVITEKAITPTPEQLSTALLLAVQEKGLNCFNRKRFDSLQQRMLWAIDIAAAILPDFSDAYLLSTSSEWLVPYLDGLRTLSDLKAIDLYEVLYPLLPWDTQQMLNEIAPISIRLPTGVNRCIEYGRLERPVFAAKITELYGLCATPAINRGHAPLLIELLSPAGRPVQLTDDLPGFWAGSYKDVQKEMKGRYPKHFWPDDPASAKATTKTKKWMT